jgi:hypothetical protein
LLRRNPKHEVLNFLDKSKERNKKFKRRIKMVAKTLLIFLLIGILGGLIGMGLYKVGLNPILGSLIVSILSFIAGWNLFKWRGLK